MERLGLREADKSAPKSRSSALSLVDSALLLGRPPSTVSQRQRDQIPQMDHLSSPCNSTFSDREGTLKSRSPLVRKSVSVPRVDFTGCSGVGCGGRSEAYFPKSLILAEPYRKPGMTSCCVPGLGYMRYCHIPGKTRPCHHRPISEAETAEIHRGSVFCSVSRQRLTCRPGPPTKVKLASEPRLLTPAQ